MNNSVIFNRIQEGSYAAKETHQWKSYRKEFDFISKITKDIEGEIIDPFARNCKWGTITNDINPQFKTTYNMDAADFLESFDSNLAKIILLDPPFSDRQSDEKYEVGDSNLYTTGDGRMGRINAEIGRILKPNGVLLKLGYNTSRPHKSLTLIRITIASFGGLRNDVLFSSWKRSIGSLEDFL